MTVNIYAPTSADGLSQQEFDLYNLIMEYRAQNGLGSIPLSVSLTTVAGRHAMDTLYNIWEPGLIIPGTSLHSWSDAPYYEDHRDPSVMWEAPQRLGTDYPGYGFEISAAGFSSIESALNGWKNSPGHNDVILQQGAWSNINFNSIGIGVEWDPNVNTYGGYIYHVWFGREVDPAGVPTIEGTNPPPPSVDELINGTAFADSLDGRDGNDTINGGDGADTISGGTGDDQINGGAQADILFGNAGSDRLDGGSGNDIIFVDSAGDVVIGGSGYDTVRFENGASLSLNLSGWSGVERVDGGNGADQLNASAWTTAVTFVGNGGNDTLIGGSAGDVIFGNAGNDSLQGGGGADALVGGPGVDIFNGGAGDDTFFVDSALETNVNGGAGLDRARVESGVNGVTLNVSNWISVERISASNGNDTLNGSGSNENLVMNGQGGADAVTGGNGSDMLFGGAGNDTLRGNGGDDFLFGDGGADEFYGGAGNDFFYLDSSSDRVVDGGTGEDRAVITKAGINLTVDGTWSGVERVDGAGGAEAINAANYGSDITLVGHAGADTLTGGSGSDTLFGGDGADRLVGGSGEDYLFGGPSDGDRDVFVFQNGGGLDRVFEFENGVDVLDLSAITGVNGFGDLTISQPGVSTNITAGDEMFVLVGIDISQVDSSDFIF